MPSPISVMQASFTGGELSPEIYARVDIQKYSVGAKTLRNFFCRATGGASNRSGLEFIVHCKSDTEVCRLFEFEFSATQSYILAFQDRSIRVVRNGAIVLEPGVSITGATQANPVVISAAAHGFANGDEVFISGVVGTTEINDRYFIVANQTAGTFELQGEDGTGHTAYTSGGTVSRVFTLDTPYLEADLFDLKFTESGDIMTICHPDYDERDLSRTDHHVWSLDVILIGPTISVPQTVGGTYSGSGTGKSYSWIVTAFDEETGEESIASAAKSETNRDLTVAGDRMQITWTAPASGNATQYNIYKDEDGSGFYGFIGSSNNLTFTDRNITPEYSDSPAMATRDPFPGAGDRPATVAYHQGRRWFAQTDNKPQGVWGSVSANFKNFNVTKSVRDDDSVTAALAGLKINEIRHMVPLGTMLIFTLGAEWIMVSSSASKGITPSTVSFNPQTYHGCSNVAPLVIDNTALFITNLDTKVRYVRYNLENDGYTGRDISILADHLFDKFALLDWAYAKAPHSLVWAVRDDGAALSMSYFIDEQIWAWSRHDTAGFFESVATATEAQEVATYFVVRRTIGGAQKKFIERLHTRKFKDVRDAFFIDSGLSLDDPKAITGATTTDPLVITAVTHGLSDGDQADIADVVGMTEINFMRFTVSNSTANTFELQDTESTPVDIDGTGFKTYISGGTVRKVETVVSGARHLAGETVVGLLDGSVEASMVVSSTGTITLPVASSRAHIGLPYIADLETLDPHFEIGGGGGPQGKKRDAGEVTLKFSESRGGWVGSNEQNIVELQQRTDELIGEPTRLQTGEEKVEIEGADEDLGRIFYRQLDPLPVTILAVIPEVTVNG